jgi:hypothetical protein
MKLADVLLLGLTIMFLIVGIDQTVVLGFSKGYWAFMMALISFFIYNYRKSRKQGPEGEPPSKSNKKGHRS